MTKPGLLFVAATLLPLVSFLFLLLVGAVRFACRRYQDNATAGAIFKLLGGDVPARWPAFVATAAIAGAFVVCVVGFVMFRGEYEILHEAEHHLTHLREHLDEIDEKAKEVIKEEQHAREHGQVKEADKLKHEAEELEKERSAIVKESGEQKAKIHKLHHAHEKHWSGHIDWANLSALSHSPEKEGKANAEEEKEDDPHETALAHAPGTALTLGFKIDHLNAIMFLMVTFIATLIHVFSMGYMNEELQKEHEDHQAHVKRRGRYGRFFLYLSLFCFSMLNLILADNLFQVFVSWELVGVCSFLLIGFYYERNSASTAANKAFITNRVGDAGFILGLIIIWSYCGTLNFDEIFRQLRPPEFDGSTASEMGGSLIRINHLDPKLQEDHGKQEQLHQFQIADREGSHALLIPTDHHFHHKHLEDGKTVTMKKLTHHNIPVRSIPFWVLTLAGLGIFLGCVGKSAQFPLQVWLPDAMEGPTPVSALIHAATMVAAGVYLVGRVFPIFTLDALMVIAYTGGITLFVAATIAVVQTDIKKVLAYSTVSQLGYMMLALGVGGWAAGLFHLITHAFFKALLFLCSGAVIYGCHHEQDMRKMGGLFWKMPITALTMLVGVLAIAGTPLFSGWYSKDAILAASFGFVAAPHNHLHFLLFLLPLLTAGITTFYMFRMWFMTFTGKPKDHHVAEHAHEPPAMMTIPLVLLAIMSIFVAWGLPPWEAKSSILEQEVHHAQPFAVKADFDPEYLRGQEYHDVVGLAALIVVAIGVGFALALYYFHSLDPEDARQQAPGVHTFLMNKWYFDELYSACLVRPALVVGSAFKWFDTVVIDGIIHGLAWLAVRVSKIDGWFDSHVVDGLVNLTGRTVYSVGGWFRTFQTGYLRNYVLFLVMGAVAIFVAVWFLVTYAMAG
jgi:NADH-quinone oxidoreductase subunit L